MVFELDHLWNENDSLDKEKNHTLTKIAEYYLSLDVLFFTRTIMTPKNDTRVYVKKYKTSY